MLLVEGLKVINEFYSNSRPNYRLCQKKFSTICPIKLHGINNNQHPPCTILSSHPPSSCVHEYMDVYAEVQSSDPAELINSPFGGRYCGPIPPRRRISLYRAIALSFYTDKNSTTPDIFEGRYAFINECKSRRPRASFGELD